MNWQTILVALLVVLWAAAQYGLAAHALLDLHRRPTVRGNNKVVWALVILGIPIAGALLYTVYGPTSFIRRGPAFAQAESLPGRTGQQPQDDHYSSNETAPHRHGSRVSRAESRGRQHAEPIEHLPEIPELAAIDAEIESADPDANHRRAANRLVRQAQRKIRR